MSPATGIDTEPDVAAFREEAATFVGSRYPRRNEADSLDRDERVALPIVAGLASTPEEERAAVAASRAWQRQLYDAGLGWVTGPLDLGGRGLAEAHADALRAVMTEHHVPDDTLIRTGTQVLGPSILHFGTDHLRSHHLPAIHRGDELMCQLFSEPDAGSDLANIRTRGRREGDQWLLDGQKVWSSGAMHADSGLCIARTDPSSARHSGLSAFVIDMSDPGVEVRPIRQITGVSEFCQVFLSDVRVDERHLVGEVGGGWKVVIDALMNERSSIGHELLPDTATMDRLLDLVRRSEPSQRLRAEAADVASRLMVARLLDRRIRERYAPGETPGPELALTKLALTEVVGGMSRLASTVLGPELVADSGRPGRYVWAEFVLGGPGLRIGGGTDEVLKNGVAERVLGLPREPAWPSREPPIVESDVAPRCRAGPIGTEEQD